MEVAKNENAAMSEAANFVLFESYDKLGHWTATALHVGEVDHS
jgi:hypothetical protein